MLKLVYVLIYFPFITLLVGELEYSTLDSAHWASYILWSTCMVVFCILGIAVFRDIWIKKGFEGKDEKLDMKESVRYLACVIAYSCFEILLGLKATEFNGVYPQDHFAYILFSTLMMASGGFAASNKANDVIDKLFNK